MTLRQMEYFLTVVEEGSFSLAANQLNVSQPALSQQVKALEQELGTALVERLGRGVRTPRPAAPTCRMPAQLLPPAAAAPAPSSRR